MPTNPVKARIKARALIKTGLNAKRAALLVNPNLTDYSAGMTGHRMLKDVEVQKALGEELAKRGGIATAEEAQETLTSIMRAGSENGKIRTSETMLRVHGVLVDRRESLNVNVNATADQLEKVLAAALERARARRETPAPVGEGGPESGQTA